MSTRSTRTSRVHAQPGGRSRIGVVAAAATCVVAAGAVGVASLGSADAKVAKTSATKLMTLSDQRINESSGLARSGYVDDKLWTVNDSGGGTTLYALDTSGRTTATYNLAGASHKDWEAMARKNIHGVSYLYIGDIGDNGKKRSSIFVHRLAEPKPGAPSGNVGFKTFEFKYPDGAHNAEAMMVRPGSNRIVIVTKGKKVDGGIYVAPKSLSSTHVNVLKKVGIAPPGMSDAVYLRNGSFVLRGYVNGWVYKSVSSKPVGFALPLKGETITHWHNPAYVVIGSEHKNSAIWKVAVP